MLKVRVPDGFSDEDVGKALEATAKALRSENKPKNNFRKQNPAANALMEYIDEAYNTMSESLAKEIAKVFEQGANK